MSELSVTLQSVIRWIFITISFSAVVCLFWSFAGVFTQKKWFKITLVGIMIFVSVGAYVLNNGRSKVVYQKEDVLYIKPAPKPY